MSAPPASESERMESDGEREFLLGIFLMEAWDTAGALEEGLAQLAAPGGAPADRVMPSLLVQTHRLKGSAALQGFPGLAELAATAESRLETLSAADRGERAETLGLLGEMVTLFKDLFDGISATGAEDAERIIAFQARHAIAESTASVWPADPACPPAADPGGEADDDAPDDTDLPVVARSGARSAQELDRFFAEGGDILTYFVPEAADHLEAMTAALLGLEREGWNAEHLATVFRAVHTLKGAAYTVGCAPVGDVSHMIEDLLVALRERQLALTPAIVEAALAWVDALKLVLQTGAVAGANSGAMLEGVVDEVRRLMLPGRGTAVPAAEPAPLAASSSGPEQVPLPARQTLHAVKPAPLTRPLRQRVAAGVGPSLRVSLDRLDSLMNLVGELMIARSRLERRLAQLDQVGEQLRWSRSRMVRVIREFERKHLNPQLPTARMGDGGGSGPPSGRAADGASLAELFAELEFDRYDDFNILARSLGEVSADLGEVQAQHAALVRAIREDMAQIQRLTAALRKEVTRSRMVPIGRLFPRFARQVREAARAAGKNVTFEVHGESVEVDNTTVEQLSDSLLHLVQNAISHGIESEEERLAKGKPARGTVCLRAYQQGGFIIVEIEDDGRGMNPERLRRQAQERGLLRDEDARALSTPEVLNLIFVPGFSTASSVTRASGRGVGMDVVRTNVTRLNGEIQVETEAGVRTRFTIKLPLTVAIAEALMVRVGGETLAIPLTTVRVMRLLSPGSIQASGDREIVSIDNEPVDLIRLCRVLGLAESEPPTLIPVVVLRCGGKPFAVAVDELYGKEEIVVKSLGEFLEGVGPFAGATISGEGRVILLLDPSRLIELGREVALAHLAGRPSGHPAPVLRADEGLRRVLLVDDSISVRRFVGQMLEKAGLQVVTAVDGQDALERLTETSVHAVITDLEMPRVNGYALIEDLRRRRATREVPIVVLTTRSGEKHQNLARRLGIRHYVTKPVDEQAFVELIHSIVSPAARPLALHGSARR